MCREWFEISQKNDDGGLAMMQSKDQAYPGSMLFALLDYLQPKTCTTCYLNDVGA
jgi:hypothetical protein